MPRKVEQIWTVGHSTHEIEEFINVLASHQIGVVADVRRFPGSRRYPQFGRDQLAQSLGKAGIEYVHLPELGGRRTARSDSPNTAWRSKAFRGYADYMMTREFRAGIERLVEVAAQKRTAVMCAEAVWWRCHRGLIADYLKVRGWKVWHIMGPNSGPEHPFTSAARLVDGKLSYGDGELGLKLNVAGQTRMDPGRRGRNQGEARRKTTDGRTQILQKQTKQTKRRRQAKKIEAKTQSGKLET